MDFRPNAGDRAFREEIRSFLVEHGEWTGRPPADRGCERDEVMAWSRVLAAKGWLVPHWPVEWGGKNWPPLQHYVLQEELIAAGCPRTDRIGLDMVGPLIFTFADRVQCQRFLPRIAGGTVLWCQGFSESDAGSDVSAIRTRAVRDREWYVVAGRKLWTTQAHIADMMFALVRVSANGKLQQGLTFLLIDMHSKGIRVTPIVTLDGRHSINEVLLEDVRVPADNRIGEEGKGWLYSRTLLSHERALIAGIPIAKERLRIIATIVSRRERGGVDACRDPVASQLTRLRIELASLEFAVQRLLARTGSDPSRDALTSIVKLRGVELRQKASALLLEAIGERALIDHRSTSGAGNHWKTLDEYRASAASADFLFERGASIAGGTSEIQKNIIAGLALEM
jgi:alkylation response protein AidB-like acyl-CoA dehydrogenase